MYENKTIMSGISSDNLQAEDLLWLSLPPPCSLDTSFNDILLYEWQDNKI